VTRRTLAARIATQAGLSAQQAAQVLEVLPAIVAAELAATGKMHWRGMGSFAVRTYAARRIHNPATGSTTTLPARRSISFKPSNKLRAGLTVKRSATRGTSR
jgi:nucleoid DNA-binding protein